MVLVSTHKTRKYFTSCKNPALWGNFVGTVLSDLQSSVSKWTPHLVHHLGIGVGGREKRILVFKCHRSVKIILRGQQSNYCWESMQCMFFMTHGSWLVLCHFTWTWVRIVLCDLTHFELRKVWVFLRKWRKFFLFIWFIRSCCGFTSIMNHLLVQGTTNKSCTRSFISIWESNSLQRNQAILRTTPWEFWWSLHHWEMFRMKLDNFICVPFTTKGWTRWSFKVPFEAWTWAVIWLWD